MRLATVQKRNAFTLVELLVVIAIIVILMALTVGVISKVYVYLDEVKVNTEVNRMAQGCEQFKSTFGRYPPSRIILCDNPVVYNNIMLGSVPLPPNSGLTMPQFQQLAAFSIEYLSSIFPGINLSTTSPVIRDWNGNGSIDAQLLDGTECLVYFLGGMRYGGAAPTGFNTDKSNPTFQTNSTRLGPFFEFEPSRLAVSPKPDYPLYKDVYGSAYLYFASVNTNVNSYRNPFFPFVNSIGNDCHSYLYSLNPTAVLFAPYFSSTVPVSGPGSWSAAGSFKFLKSDTYQIISAGKDKQYGTGGQWSQVDPEQSAFLPPGVMSGPPYNVTITTDMIQANYDNITNFAGGRVVPK